MSPHMVISSVALQAAADVMPDMRDFYVGGLGFASLTGADRLALAVGRDRMEFAAAAAGERPFYHLALLVPGNRYAAARRWVERCADLLSRPGETATTFRFAAWDADACYFHDPAGNIVELIAHAGIGETSAADAGFAAAELVGISEVGLVVRDPPAAARRLAAAGLELWSGSAEGEDALAFVGRRAHTLILCPPGRPWLPTQRPAECHPATASLTGAGGDTVTVDVVDGALTTAGW
jgi:catechol 2,3-dioxygenase-like lactoylglutathione lyase family enzyme